MTKNMLTRKIKSRTLHACMFCIFLLFTDQDLQADVASWIIRFDIDTPAEIERTCNAAKSAGFDALLVQVRGRADAYYKSRIAPRAESLVDDPPDFDPLASVLKACGSIPVHAWLNVYYLWTGNDPPADPTHAAGAGRSWILRDVDGRKVSDYSEFDRAVGWIEGIYADPASSGYRRRFASIVKELLDQYDLAGIHLDFVRYPGPAYGHGGKLGRKFQKTWGFDPRWIPDGSVMADLDGWLSGDMDPAEQVLTTAALLWADLRSSRITALVRDVRKAICQSGRNVALSAAIFPDFGPAFVEKGQDWLYWTENGLVDALFPMAYFGEPERVGRQLENVAALLKPSIQAWAGLGAYIKEPEKIRQEAVLARSLGYHKICLFDLGHLLMKPSGYKPYVRAVREYTPSRAFTRMNRLEKTNILMPVPALSSAETTDNIIGLKRFQEIVKKALGCRLPAGVTIADYAGIVEIRWNEFNSAQKISIPNTLNRLRSARHLCPGWVELQGIFRFVHDLDTLEKRDEQKEICEEAKKQVIRGADFEYVARKMSQGGSKNFGGRLGRRYLSPANRIDITLAGLKPGELSPVMEVENGYWFYRAETTAPPRMQPLSKIPWPARRIIFCNTLAEIMGKRSQAPHLHAIRAISIGGL
ncbi:MAG: family 10 glycosylhydrolase [Thermodesulfobacteriota bacterium]|nr:family 10 glycosylhydrolase [Thermodesulfobacteriota bacterium]